MWQSQQSVWFTQAHINTHVHTHINLIFETREKCCVCIYFSSHLPLCVTHTIVLPFDFIEFHHNYIFHTFWVWQSTEIWNSSHRWRLSGTVNPKNYHRNKHVKSSFLLSLVQIHCSVKIQFIQCINTNGDQINIKGIFYTWIPIKFLLLAIVLSICEINIWNRYGFSFRCKRFHPSFSGQEKLIIMEKISSGDILVLGST